MKMNSVLMRVFYNANGTFDIVATTFIWNGIPAATFCRILTALSARAMTREQARSAEAAA